MKLRIKGNSIRLRLGQSEVRRLASEGTVAESTVFGPSQHFCYELCMSQKQTVVSASFAEGHLVIRVPASMILEWAGTDQVGIDALQRTGDDSELRILIEKDFECIDAPHEESQEDAFPNPQIGAVC